MADEYLGELAVDHVRGRETYMFRYDPAYLRSDPDGGEHALAMGDLIADAGYYRLTKSEADREYARMREMIVR